jgi:GSH-dependent disulfide-bond oxidoreductase
MTIELHTWNTPNGRKISVALEEMGLPYKVFPVNITKGDQMAPEFLAISPNNKIPAIVDSEGPDGKRVSVFESGAILLYLGEKTGKFLPKPLAERIPVYEWLMWQMGGFGPMPGQVHHFIALENACWIAVLPIATSSRARCPSPILPFSAGPGGTRATRWSFPISPTSNAGTRR